MDLDRKLAIYRKNLDRYVSEGQTTMADIQRNLIKRLKDKIAYQALKSAKK